MTDEREGRSSGPQASHSARPAHPLGQLFDRYLMVDWSARSVSSPKKPSADAIWWAEASQDGTASPVYCRTRTDAVEQIAERIADVLDQGERILVGFDFPFGYPAGVAERVSGRPKAKAMWDWLADRVEDQPNNANRRYEVASEINRAYDGIGPCWGRPATWNHPDVPTHATVRLGNNHPPERRLAEGRQANTKTVWQLAGAGAVGSQVLLGLPALKRLAEHPRLKGRIAFWPFDIGFGVPKATCVIAEIYPSLLSKAIRERQMLGEVLDAAQVRVLATAFAQLDASKGLGALFEAPTGLSADELHAVETEEAWILGLDHKSALEAALGQAPPKRFIYERDPAAIYTQSFATVRREVDFTRFPDDAEAMAVRLIHACGMTEIARDLQITQGCVAAGLKALRQGKPILCDAEMVAQGIIRRFLPDDVEVVTTLNDPRTSGLAAKLGTTRSAAAVELWRDQIDGAIVAIGNAPTALFHLLERLSEGWPRPALILGFPVGFVGAAESKAGLINHADGIEYATLTGRKGGSAMAAAAVNALTFGLAGDGR